MSEIIQTEAKVNLYEEIYEVIGDRVMADCFISLCLSVIRQWLLSSDHKFFIFNGMLKMLETKYSEQEVDKIKQGLQIIIEKYNVYNDFVG